MLNLKSRHAFTCQQHLQSDNVAKFIG